MSTPSLNPGSDSEVPEPEPDASCRQITPRPVASEYGVDAVGRQVASHVAQLLNWPVTDLTVRENPWHRRPCPQASFYDMTCAGHRIRITLYETQAPSRRGTYTAQAITLDGRPIPFRRLFTDSLAWQLAETIWSAHLDLPEHTHPINQDSEDRSQS